MKPAAYSATTGDMTENGPSAVAEAIANPAHPTRQNSRIWRGESTKSLSGDSRLFGESRAVLSRIRADHQPISFVMSWCTLSLKRVNPEYVATRTDFPNSDLGENSGENAVLKIRQYKRAFTSVIFRGLI